MGSVKRLVRTAGAKERARARRIRQQAERVVEIFQGERREDSKFWPTVFRLAAAELEREVHRRTWNGERHERPTAADHAELVLEESDRVL